MTPADRASPRDLRGLLAARSITSALAGALCEDHAFAEFEGRYRREYGVRNDFLSAFYEMRAHEDNYFRKAKKVTSFDTADLEAFMTLVGGVAAREAALTDPAALTRRFTDSPRALSEAVEATGSTRPESGERMNHLFSAPVVGDVMQEKNEIQRRGVLGTAVREAPLLPDGLVPSLDGLAWAAPTA